MQPTPRHAPTLPARSATRPWAWPCGMLLGLALACSAQAGTVADRVKERRSVRVCIWPDYYGVTFRHPRTRQLSGIDIDLSAELGKDLGARVDYVETSFATLVPDLQSERCDVAMFAIGMTAERKERLDFTRPYLASDIYGITTRSNPVVRQWADIDRPGVLVGVQAGTFMGPVMAGLLQHARLVTIAPPATRERELEGGRIDVFMTDYPYSRRLLDNADWARLVAPPQPVHVLPYAYAVRQGDAAWLKTMDDFVARIQRDGRLDAKARRNGLSGIVVR